MKKKTIGILGSTGSIGCQTLSLLKDNKNYQIIFLSCNRNIKKLFHQVKIFKPKHIYIIDKKSYNKFKAKNKFRNLKIYNDLYKLKRSIKNKLDYTVSAFSGNQGFDSTFEVSEISRNLLIANKEAIILGNNILKKKLKKNKCNLIPIDSEHYSIFKFIKDNKIIIKNIHKIFITASGGPFYNKKINFKNVTIKNALRHPNWKMGKKISIDSATLANKILEYFEAIILFSFKPDNIIIRIQPSSKIHSIVLMKSGFYYLIAHNNDMKIPISSALNLNSIFKNSDKIVFEKQKLSFYKPNSKQFKLIRIAKKVANLGHSAMIMFSVINERLVYKFLQKEITFDKISSILLYLFSNKKFISLCKTYIRSKKDIYNIVKIAEQYRLD